MNMKQLTEKAQEAILAAQSLGGEMSHSEITPEHLLVTLVEQQNGIVPSILRKMNLDPARASKDARGLLAAIPQVQGGDLRLSPRMQLVFDAASAEAKRLQDDFVSTEHLFVALATEAGRSPSAQYLQRQGITSNEMLSQKRAEAVMEYLIAHGVKPDMISARGLGEAEPVASNDTTQGRTQNRRVELTLAGAGT